MDVCDCDWDIGECNAESKAEWREVTVKNNWILSSQDKGKISYLLSAHQENVVTNIHLCWASMSLAQRPQLDCLHRFPES